VTGGTATGGGIDYTLASGTLTFAAGDTSKTIAITVVDDALDEAIRETIEVTLSNPTNATLGDTTTHTFSIIDNDEPPTVAFDSPSSSGSEATTPANLTVSLSAASGQTVTQGYKVAGGTASGGGVDYTLDFGFLTFAPGEISKVIVITVVDDTLDEAEETIVVALSSPTNATLGVTGTHTYTIVDNDVTAAPTATNEDDDDDDDGGAPGGGGQPPPALEPEPTPTTIESDSGTVTSQGGGTVGTGTSDPVEASVEVPPGAVDQNTDIQIESISAADPALPTLPPQYSQ